MLGARGGLEWTWFHVQTPIVFAGGCGYATGWHPGPGCVVRHDHHAASGTGPVPARLSEDHASMSKKISFQDIDGKSVSGQFKVSDGKITVTASDGRTRTVDVNESMLGTETLAKMLLLQMHREDDGPVDSWPRLRRDVFDSGRRECGVGIFLERLSEYRLQNRVPAHP
jgi:hypothetical protein